MNQILTNFIAFKRAGYLLILVCLLMGFQQGNAQHCIPGFHFSVDGKTVTFSDQSTSNGTITSWAWNFGDGTTSTEQNPSHIYANQGTYTVCLNITDDHGCTSHVCHQVVIHHPPAGVCHAAFVFHQTDLNQPNFSFTDKSTSDGTIGFWSWDFGDGTTSSEQNPIHTYANPGTYTVCLTITDEDGVCSSHVCQHVVVHHPPAGVCHAIFVFHQIDPDQQTISFTDQSTSDGTIGTWAWNFGDGNTSNEQNPTHTYTHPGTYTVCLIITDTDGGCTSHVCHHVIVHHPHGLGLIGESVTLLPTEYNDLKGGKYNYFVNYPNPFMTSTTIKYELTDEADVLIEIYDMQGIRTSTINNKKESKGVHTQVINAFNLNPGYYYIRMAVGKESYVKKITVEK